MLILEVLFYSFVIVVVIQVLYYGVLFGSFAFSKSENTTNKSLPISVIICAKNEAENIKKILPYLLKQDYPTFEIVLINDSSNDNTLEVFETFATKHYNIKIVDVKNIEAFWGNKKYALSLGIKAAKYNNLLFTDADCQPISNQWIKEMSSHFSNKNTIVLGYGAYNKIKNSLLNSLIRFETLLTATQYFSYAKIGLPYMGVGRNLAYHRDEFFKTNGFIKHMKIRSGDDDLFINEAANAKNTSICYSKNSFTTSFPKTTYKDWYKQKRRHISTANHYKFKHRFLLATFYITQVLFWLLGITLLITTFLWPFVLGLIILRFLIQYLSLGFSAKKLNELDTILLLPILEIILIVLQFSIFITNQISKPNYWK
ncbi:glycosyltransferase [Olleya aquimaris]|uniref:Cellulose synthase/poly-beta-1,6-N-acetylglucosamine synthase-like glycosyltransferase n=1 Tax=Olleya aquimaris TaxID=639310 RepID=A0A327REY6_9FLAO|nr:glycosyltransferase [Olleya aquimaris]RAJ14492.1 cellulose synthase/poly-beta-1,6-N-acetylglucosamine synthase-like glycosyltransferase [Olleya aquimaris]